MFLKTKRNDLARPVMGTIFLVYKGIIYMEDFWHVRLPIIFDKLNP